MMDRRAFLVSLFTTLSVMWRHVAAASGERQATFTKGKFAVPISPEAVEADWTARGYSKPKVGPIHKEGPRANILTRQPHHDHSRRAYGIHLRRRALCRRSGRRN